MTKLSNFAFHLSPKDEKSAIEDQVFIDEKSQVFVVIDGVSSSNGKLAGEFAVKSLESLRASMVNLLPNEIVQFVDDQMLDENLNRQKYITPQKPMLASMVVVKKIQNELLYSHLGDSRVMLYREGKLISLTTDHSLLQEKIDNYYVEFEDEMLLKSPLRHVLTRSLGQNNSDYPSGKTNVIANDVVMICSDGLTHTLLNSKLGEIIKKADKMEVTDKSKFLVKELSENVKDAKDDLSVIVISI